MNTSDLIDLITKALPQNGKDSYIDATYTDLIEYFEKGRKYVIQVAEQK